VQNAVSSSISFAPSSGGMPTISCACEPMSLRSRDARFHQALGQGKRSTGMAQGLEPTPDAANG